MELTPVAVETAILELSDKLDYATNKMLSRCRQAAEADAAYDIAYHQARLNARYNATSKITVDEVESVATIQAQAEYRSKVLAEAELKSLQEGCRNIRAQLDALRTLATSLRPLVTS